MKVLIQGLGEAPIPIELALEKEKPSVTYIICSDYQLSYIHPKYTKSNWEVVTEAARKSKTELFFKRCDVFDPKAVRDCLIDILKKVDPYEDELIFNYTSGSAPVRLFLGIVGAQLSKFAKNVKILYTIHYGDEGVEIVDNHTAKLREFLPTDIDVLLDFASRKSSKETKKKKSQR
jgi:hypothetical protein